MKTTFSLVLAALSTFALAAPSASKTRQIKRAAVDDVAFGYASTNGGTKGGAGGTTTTVSSFAAFTSAAQASGPAVIYISGTISGSGEVRPTSNKTIIGKDSSAKLVNIGIFVKGVSNVIIRNFAISKVVASNGDAINIQKSTNVWVDHMDLSSDLVSGKDYYDGLCDVNHASDWITISNVYFHDHFKSSLVGHSDSNAAEDTGKLHVTYANNHWANTNSRLPSVRFGTAHIYNSYYDTADTGVNTRMGAQVLVESTVFSDVKYPVLSKDSKTIGYAIVRDNVYGIGANTAELGNLTSVPYSYTLLGSGAVEAAVVGSAGNTLTF